MNYKKSSIILSIFFIFSINILLLINNRQKTSFRYFIWNLEEISIGKLIFISFTSGLLMSSLVNKTLQFNNRTISKNKEDEKINIEEDNESIDMPPERDLRDTQPTISVNYRVIKDNGINEIKDINQRSKNMQYQDDWENNDSEW